MRIQEIIAKKRDGYLLSSDELSFFVQGYTRGEIPDYQAAALLMAIYLRGMNPQETADLTAAMASSGEQLDLGDFIGALDKHSTGGVGDKTSLIVVPILAALGVPICKMSGRGLGHTGGTLDKLEAIPGFSVVLTPEQMVAQVHAIGACLAGQTEALAPADKKLYALRDATATVASLPLIVSSILSKKLAGGAPAFLFDVKVGKGALMKSDHDALELARALVMGAQAQGRRAVALLTDMDQPLGRTIGNALEVAEAIEVLTSPDRADPRLRELCCQLAEEGLVLSQGVTRGDASQEVHRVLHSGAAASKFAELIAAQGGDATVVAHPERLAQAPLRLRVVAREAGYVTHFDTQALGEIVVRLGGGRATKDAEIDPAVGITLARRQGESVQVGQLLAQVHACDTSPLDDLMEAVYGAIRLGSTPVETSALVRQVVRSSPS